MRPALHILVAALLLAALPGVAWGQASGGTAPVGSTASVGGGTAPTGRPPAGRAPQAPIGGATGGNRYGRPFQIPPVVRRFSASPRSVVWGGRATTLRFRVDSVNRRSVRVVLGIRRVGSRSVRRVALGRVRTGRLVSRRWARPGIDPGTYRLSLLVVSSRGRTLARVARTTITVRVRPRPKPPPVPRPVAGNPGDGVFPVRGPVSYTGSFGEDRGDHRHNGQDLAAALGTPLVSPRRGTVIATGYGAGSGYYVVIKDSALDRSYVFFHLQAGSTVVSQGQSVRAGQRIGSVGSTGNSTGPHLHFELWIGGWWSGGHAIDPLPTLRSWAR